MALVDLNAVVFSGSGFVPGDTISLVVGTAAFASIQANTSGGFICIRTYGVDTNFTNIVNNANSVNYIEVRAYDTQAGTYSNTIYLYFA
jgi:hypothetical protein